MANIRLFARFRVRHIVALVLCLFVFILAQIVSLHRSHLTSTEGNFLLRQADSLFQPFLAPSPIQEDDDLVAPLNSKSSPIEGKTFFDVSPHFAIHIIGERHSGVDTIEKELQRCFGHAIHVKSGLVRSAHWWQSPRTVEDAHSLTEGEYGVVVALFRNPYDWVEAMHVEPQYALDHWNIIKRKPLDWQDFLNKSWTVDRAKFKDWMSEDVQLLMDIRNEYYPSTNTTRDMNEDIIKTIISSKVARNRLARQSCTEDFYWFDVVPCSKNDRESTKILAPFQANMLYELQRDGSGNPYDNILQLRNDKLQHFHDEVSKFKSVQHYLPFHYEDLISHGTQLLLVEVEKALPGVKAQCQPTQPKPYIYKVLPYPMIDHINANTNWTVEASVGYKKFTDKEWWEVRQEHDRLDKNRREETALELEMNQDKSMYGIHIIGERHTGTLWLQHQLEKCFGDRIKIYPSLSRYKYWFQFDNPHKDYGLVIATFRNVYDWTLAMMDNPLHAPLHYNSTSHAPLSVQDFLQKKWSLTKEAWDTFLKDDRNTFLFSRDLETHSCYDNFTFFDVSPCSYYDRLRTQSIVKLSGDLIDNGDSSAVYEMRRDHAVSALKPYENILQLRRDKMINFRSDVPQFFSVKHYISVKFEDMVNQGLESLMAEVELKLGINSSCTAEKLPIDGIPVERYTEDFLRRINEGVDWDAEAMLGYEKITRDKQHYGIHVIGERHTGTSWLYRHLEQCFGDQVKVYDRLSRHKYWFQFDDWTKDYGLVVATSRNVYDWLYAMMEKPFHAPIHYDAQKNASLGFIEFIQTEWAPDRDKWNKLELLKDDQQLLYAYEHAELFSNVTQGKPLEIQQCYDGFTFFDVMPCSYNDRMRSSNLIPILSDSIIDDGDYSPVYEMKKDHPLAEIKPYKNIMELRRDKMIHFFSEVPNFSCVKHFISVKFEDMIDVGTEALLQDIVQKLNLQSRCQPDKLQLPNDYNKAQLLTNIEISNVNQGVDWNAEAIMGYKMVTLDLDK